MTTVVLTGGGRGLGRSTAERLVAAGHRVVLVGQSEAQAMRAVAEIRRSHPGADVEARFVDLSSLDAVGSFAAATLEAGEPIGVLFHVAGVMQAGQDRTVTVEGLERTLAVNALAPFLLTGLLLPLLEPSGETRARVITVSSRLHLPDSRGRPVDFDFDDPHLERGYHPQRAYKNSKLALLWFTYELQRRLDAWPITANSVCPGFVPATTAATAHGPMRLVMRHVMPHLPFATSVDEATRSLVFMALDSSIEGVGGRFFGECHEIDSSPESRDPARAQRFWELATRTVSAAGLGGLAGPF